MGGLFVALRSIERGGGSDRFSVDEEAVLFDECVAYLATAVKLDDAVGRVYWRGGEYEAVCIWS